MYTNTNCKILQQYFEQKYINLFQQYYIAKMYGDEVIMGSDLIDDQ